jgi:ATP-dependent Clp endopeptidase proteolytic subunit ClpP
MKTLQAFQAPRNRTDRARETFNRAGVPSGKWYAIQQPDEGEEFDAEILIFDEIGFYGITAEDFIADLANVAGSVKIRINSPGGDVFAGITIFNALASRKGRVVCQIDGLAASAASFIALAGDEVIAYPSAMLMVHRAWGVGVGNCQDLQGLADVLSKIDGQLADLYAAKSGKSAKVTLGWMDAETWFTADEAKAAGLVDTVIATEGNNNKRTSKAASASAARNRRLMLARADMTTDEQLNFDVAALRQQARRQGARR